jgi:hypothetical protein
MMNLTIRKIVVLGLIGMLVLIGNILFVANWLSEKSVTDWAGTAITIVVVLLILLVSPKATTRGLVRRCPVCDHVLLSQGMYCSECGSKAA